MAEDGVALLDELVRADRNGHVNSPELPLHPGTSVEPDRGVVQPVVAFLLELFDGLKGGLGADPVRSVRVGEVTCHVDLVRVDPDDQLLDNVKVFLCARQFRHSARLVERQVEEVDIGVVVEAEASVRSSGLAAADGRLDGEKLLRLRLTRLL